MVPILKVKDGTVFLTAKHVAVMMKKDISAFHPEYGIIRKGIKVLKLHPTMDIATIFVPVLDARIIPVRRGPRPALGDRCTVVAYPGPGRRRITEGNICGPYTISAQIIGGSSGGPVFDRYGRLIGLVRAVDVKSIGFGGRIAIQWMGYYTPVTPEILVSMLR
jgi:S1-C subfamily serine protease